MGSLLTKILNDIDSDGVTEEVVPKNPHFKSNLSSSSKEEEAAHDDDDDENEDDRRCSSDGSFTGGGSTNGGIMDDPRSPATVGVDRTPLPSAVALDNQAPWDPRSPTSGILRTPMHPPLFDTPAASAESTMLTQQEADPVGLPAPIAVECDVHRSWHVEHDSVLAEWDSLYANPGSEVSRTDNGSLENLLLSNADSMADENSVFVSDGEGNSQNEASPASPDVSPIGSPAKKPLAADSENAAVEKLHSSTPIRPPTASLSMSSEKVKVRGLSSRDNNSPSVPVEKSMSHGLTVRDVNSPKITSASKCSVKGLTARDTNSPLLLLRHKQVIQAGNHLVRKDSSDDVLNKENLVQ